MMNKWLLRIGSLALALTLITGCATNNDNNDNNDNEPIDETPRDQNDDNQGNIDDGTNGNNGDNGDNNDTDMMERDDTEREKELDRDDTRQR